MNVIKSFSEHHLIALQDDEWLERQRVAGRSVVFCLDAARSMIDNRPELSVSALRSELVILMKTFGCAQVLDKDKEFNSSIKIYVNNLLNTADDYYKFQDGDLIVLELGCHYLGAVAKATITTFKNKFKNSIHLEMISACQKALSNALLQIKLGKRLGSIGSGINYIIKNTTFKLSSEYAGNGLDNNNLFAEPNILSKSQSNSGIRMQEGMTFTISPRILLNSSSEIGCCFEKTIYLNKDSIEVITPWSEVN